MPSPVDSIVSAISNAATAQGSSLWNEIRTSAQIFARGYAQTLIETAKAVESGDMTQAEGKKHAANAKILLYMGIAHVTQATLVAIQKVLDAAIAAGKTTINSVLRVPLL
jgi:hypothetical protein